MAKPYAIISYVPALHRGYLDFFKKYAGERFFVLGKEFALEYPRMDRDLRALKPEEVVKLIGALGIFKEIAVLDDADQIKDEEIIMPDEDLNRSFAKKYLKGKKIDFVPVFLRWDKQISTKESEVAPDRVISTAEFDRIMMDVAANESKKSPDWWRQIGAVIVKDNKPLLQAHNTALPSEYALNALGDPRSNFDAGEHIELSKFIHAEAGLIAEAARKGIPLEGAALYVTTFPCPVCAKSVAMAGIKKVFYQKGYSLLDAEDILKKFEVEIVLVK